MEMLAAIYSDNTKLDQQECTVRAEPTVVPLRILVDPKHDARGKKEQRAAPGLVSRHFFWLRLVWWICPEGCDKSHILYFQMIGQILQNNRLYCFRSTHYEFIS